MEGERQKKSKDLGTKMQTGRNEKYIRGKLDRTTELSNLEEFKIWYAKS